MFASGRGEWLCSMRMCGTHPTVNTVFEWDSSANNRDVSAPKRGNTCRAVCWCKECRVCPRISKMIRSTCGKWDVHRCSTFPQPPVSSPVRWKSISAGAKFYSSWKDPQSRPDVDFLGSFLGGLRMETMDPTSVHMAVAACKMLHGSIFSNDAAESAEAVEILRQHQVEFDYIDVLEHPSLRLGKKIHLAMVCHGYWWRPLRMPDPQRSTDCRSGD